MIAVDTNVLVRLLVADHPKQTRAVRSLFGTETIWIAKTVLLEAAWVLRSVYGFDESAISDAFGKLLGLRNVHAEDQQCVAAALALTSHGIEFADALHLSSRPLGAAFVSLDRPFIRRAIRAGATDVTDVPRASEPRP